MEGSPRGAWAEGWWGRPGPAAGAERLSVFTRTFNFKAFRAPDIFQSCHSPGEMRSPAPDPAGGEGLYPPGGGHYSNPLPEPRTHLV